MLSHQLMKMESVPYSYKSLERAKLKTPCFQRKTVRREKALMSAQKSFSICVKKYCYEKNMACPKNISQWRESLGTMGKHRSLGAINIWPIESNWWARTSDQVISHRIPLQQMFQFFWAHRQFDECSIFTICPPLHIYTYRIIYLYILTEALFIPIFNNKDDGQWDNGRVKIKL